MKNILASAVVKNILWLSFDKIFRLVVGLVVGIWVARYLGPGDFGKINYVTAFLGILTAVSTLGIDGFLVKDMVMLPEQKNYLMGTTFILRSIAVAISIICIFLTFGILGTESDVYKTYSILIFSVILSPFDVIDICYQSQLKSKRTVLAKNLAYICGAVVKTFLLLFKMPFFYFVFAISGETLLAYILLIVFYQQKESIFNWRFSRSTAWQILHKGWPFMISGLVVILYMRLDQIMLGSMIGEGAVGQFSAAVRISEIFAFIPMAISSSVFPMLVKIKQEQGNETYLQHLQRFFNWMLLISLSIAIVVSIFARPIVSILYGAQYVNTAAILIIHIWALIAIFLGVASSQHLVIEELNKYAFYRTSIGLVTNVALNIVLIPKFQGVGAAIATLISYYMSAIFSNLFFKPTRSIFYYQFLSLRNIILFKKNDFSL